MPCELLAGALDSQSELGARALPGNQFSPGRTSSQMAAEQSQLLGADSDWNDPV